MNDFNLFLDRIMFLNCHCRCINIADLVDIIKGTLSRDVLGWQSLKATPYQNQNDIESILWDARAFESRR
jgi:hypothetical protein